MLLAATFSLRPVRRGGAGLAVVCGVATGFLLYFVSDVVSALGVSGRVPVVLAAWSPAVVSCLLGTAMLFHLEAFPRTASAERRSTPNIPFAAGRWQHRYGSAK